MRPFQCCHKASAQAPGPEKGQEVLRLTACFLLPNNKYQLCHASNNEVGGTSSSHSRKEFQMASEHMNVFSPSCLGVISNKFCKIYFIVMACTLKLYGKVECKSHSEYLLGRLVLSRLACEMFCLQIKTRCYL